MNQPTHAWLAVEAFRTIQKCSTTDAGKQRKLDKLVALLDQHLNDVVVAAWLPDSLIKDMTFGHIFKNSKYQGDQGKRFTLSRADLKKSLAASAFQRESFLDTLPADWWTAPYRVKDNGGHLPTRVAALCQNARDMLKMGDADLYTLCGVKPPPGHATIAAELLYSARDVAVMMWMASHYIADGHMPFHCDNRDLASTPTKKKGQPPSNKNAHGKIEDLWGEQVPALFKAASVLSSTSDQILAAPLPSQSNFKGIVFETDVPPLKNGGDPWKEAVYICRASFALSFSLVPPAIAPVDDQTKQVSREDILANGGFCGEQRFWNISRAIMHDAATSIAMFWQDVWCDFVKGGEGN